MPVILNYTGYVFIQFTFKRFFNDPIPVLNRKYSLNMDLSKGLLRRV